MNHGATNMTPADLHAIGFIAKLRGRNALAMFKQIQRDDARDAKIMSQRSNPFAGAQGKIYTRAEIVNGTGFPRGARFIMIDTE